MNQNWTIAIHGGAENWNRENMTEAKRAAYEQGLDNALMAGWHILAAGGTAVDAVEAAVRSLENNPLFNAGRGGALNEKGVNEFDAAIMDGRTLAVGAVAGVRFVKNPITLAKAVKDKSKHVLLTGQGAEDFARKQELEMAPETYFLTDEQKKKLKQAQQEAVLAGHDTVGAVALDQHGNLAAATSTGGLINQLAGRVGDSPIPGAGVYANNEVCAVSCTGDGEGILRAAVAHQVYALMQYKGLSLAEAADEAMQVHKDKIEGDRNFIAVDKAGNVVMRQDTNLMFRAMKKGQEPTYIGIWEEE